MTPITTTPPTVGGFRSARLMFVSRHGSSHSVLSRRVCGPATHGNRVIFRGGRNPSNGHAHPPPPKNGAQTTPKDFIAESITLKKGLTGAKPEKVCRWVLELLNVQPGDEVVDLFPGTGIMGRVAEQVIQGIHASALS